VVNFSEKGKHGREAGSREEGRKKERTKKQETHLDVATRDVGDDWAGNVAVVDINMLRVDVEVGADVVGEASPLERGGGISGTSEEEDQEDAHCRRRGRPPNRGRAKVRREERCRPHPCGRFDR
jgi:hypothetical protein